MSTEVAEEVLNRCVSSNASRDGPINVNSPEYCVQFMYEFLDDYRDPPSIWDRWGLCREEPLNNYVMVCFVHVGSEGVVMMYRLMLFVTQQRVTTMTMLPLSAWTIMRTLGTLQPGDQLGSVASTTLSTSWLANTIAFYFEHTCHCVVSTCHCSVSTCHCSVSTCHCSVSTCHCSVSTCHCSVSTFHCDL